MEILAVHNKILTVHHENKSQLLAKIGLVTEQTFAPSFLSFLESDFALLWYEALHSEVAWTEQNADKSKFTLFSAWLITLHKVL